jgi:predicted dehydrogenase
MSCIKIGMIGLDTSHSIEFTRRLQAPDCDPAQLVAGARVATCLRFETPFQDAAGLDARQAQMEAWGVRVTEELGEAVSGCDALMLEINDPARHLEYVQACAGLGLPIFLDKPMADTLEAAVSIAGIARARGLRLWTASSLRFADALLDACDAVPRPDVAVVHGPLGIAPAGSSVVWYGVHACEMLQRAMGRGLARVTYHSDPQGRVMVAEYADGRRGVVMLTEGMYHYGGRLMSKQASVAFDVDAGTIYTRQLGQVVRFFSGGPAPVDLDDALEVMRMLTAPGAEA